MIGECLEQEAPFGVVLIQEGQAVGGPATPYRVGTTARITQVERQEDGRMNLSTLGERRFRIVETLQDSPYLKGKVEYIPEETGEIGEGVLDKAREVFEEWPGWSVRASGGLVPPDEHRSGTWAALLLNSPLSGAALRGEGNGSWNSPTRGERLYYEIPLLEGANKRIKEALIKRSPYKGPKLN